MLKGVGDEEPDVPPVFLEIEVETEMSPAEVKEKARKRRSSRPHPHPPKFLYKQAPFRNAKDFGVWLMETMNDQAFQCVYTLFSQYQRSLRMKKFKKLVAFGKLAFQKPNQLFCFFEGLFIVAVSVKHKDIVAHAYHHRQLQLKMWRDLTKYSYYCKHL